MEEQLMRATDTHYLKDGPVNTTQIVRDLNIDKELYFERHLNIYGMEKKV